jgi:hypothetical protein
VLSGVECLDILYCVFCVVEKLDTSEHYVRKQVRVPSHVFFPALFLLRHTNASGIACVIASRFRRHPDPEFL